MELGRVESGRSKRKWIDLVKKNLLNKGSLTFNESEKEVGKEEIGMGLCMYKVEITSHEYVECL